MDRGNRASRPGDGLPLRHPGYGPALHHLHLPYCLELAQDGLPGAKADEFVPDLVNNVIDDMDIDGGDAIRHFQRSSTQNSEKQTTRTPQQDRIGESGDN